MYVEATIMVAIRRGADIRELSKKYGISPEQILKIIETYGVNKK